MNLDPIYVAIVIGLACGLAYFSVWRIWRLCRKPPRIHMVYRTAFNGGIIRVFVYEVRDGLVRYSFIDPNTDQPFDYNQEADNTASIADFNAIYKLDVPASYAVNLEYFHPKEQHA